MRRFTLIYATATTILLALLTTAIFLGRSAAVRAETPATRPAATAPSDADSLANGVETIVFLRHGEKPKGGLGQLTPQGLNRALALSRVLPEKFGKPDYLFAPDPAEKVTDRGSTYNYIRPLATIEPTAIVLQMPVQTPCGYSEIDKLNEELTSAKYANSLIFVAWEHLYEARAAVNLLRQFSADPAVVPAWAGADYDSLYVIKITRKTGEAPKATFTLDHEGLNGQSKTMPTPAPAANPQ